MVKCYEKIVYSAHWPSEWNESEYIYWTVTYTMKNASAFLMCKKEFTPGETQQF